MGGVRGRRGFPFPGSYFLPRKTTHNQGFKMRKLTDLTSISNLFLSKNYFVDSNVPSSNIVTLPETNSKFAPENGGLEYKPILLGPGLRGRYITTHPKSQFFRWGKA